MGVITATLGIDCNNTLVYIYHNSPEIFNNNFVIKYIQRVKIETASMSLESSCKIISEVMYKVGYNDTKAFRTTFKKITGLSPVQYRNKYNRELAA